MGWITLGIEDWDPGRGIIFHTCPNWPRGPPSLLYEGYQVSFLGVNWPGRDVEHTHPSSAKVKEGAELYLHSLSGPSWPAL